MPRFPSAEQLDEQACCVYLQTLLRPKWLRCPRGHPLPPDQLPHDRHRDPKFNYRCRECGAVFNLFTQTLWSKTHYSCKTIVWILQGIAAGVSTQQLAAELDVDRSHLSRRRAAIEALVDRGLPVFRKNRKRRW